MRQRESGKARAQRKGIMQGNEMKKINGKTTEKTKQKGENGK